MGEVLEFLFVSESSGIAVFIVNFSFLSCRESQSMWIPIFLNFLWFVLVVNIILLLIVWIVS